MNTGKTIALTIWTFVSNVMSLLFNMLSRFTIAFISRSKHLIISWLLCPWNSPGKNTRVGSHPLLQGIFPMQGSNSGLPRYRQIRYRPSHQGSPAFREAFKSLYLSWAVWFCVGCGCNSSFLLDEHLPLYKVLVNGCFGDQTGQVVLLCTQVSRLNPSLIQYDPSAKTSVLNK